MLEGVVTTDIGKLSATNIETMSRRHRSTLEDILFAMGGRGQLLKSTGPLSTMPLVIWPDDSPMHAGETFMQRVDRLTSNLPMNPARRQELYDSVVAQLVYPKTTKRRCAWHHGSISGVPVPSLGNPVRVPGSTLTYPLAWTVESLHCSFECEAAYRAKQPRDAYSHARERAMADLYRQSGGKGIVTPAMDWRLQEEYSGIAGISSACFTPLVTNGLTAEMLKGYVFPRVNTVDVRTTDLVDVTKSGTERRNKVLQHYAALYRDKLDRMTVPEAAVRKQRSRRDASNVLGHRNGVGQRQQTTPNFARKPTVPTKTLHDKFYAPMASK